MIILQSQCSNRTKRPRSTATNGSSILFLSLSIVLFAINASGEEDVMTKGQHHRRQKKKSPKHFSLDYLVDEFDGDDVYFVSYNEKQKKSKAKKSGKKDCNVKAGSNLSSSKKKKKKKKEKKSSSRSSKSEAYEDCTLEPTIIATYAPTISPTTVVPTVQPTFQSITPPTSPPTYRDMGNITDDGSGDDDNGDDEGDYSSEKGKKSKKKKSDKGKKEKTKMRVEVVPDVASGVSTRSSELTSFKVKVTPKFRAERPISIPFPSKSPIQEPTSFSMSNTSKGTAALPTTVILTPSTAMPSSKPTTASSIETWLDGDHTILLNGRTATPMESFTESPSTTPILDESKIRMKNEVRTSEDLPTTYSLVPVEASPFYLTFLLQPFAENPSYSSMEEAFNVSTIFLDMYVNTTFSLIDASDFWRIMMTPVSFSADFQSIELMTSIEFTNSSEFIPGTDDIDMLLEIAFSEPSVNALLTMLSELPPDNPFQQTVSVKRTVGHLVLNHVATAPSSSSSSTIRGTVAGACATAFMMVAFAAVYRKRNKHHQFTKVSNKTTQADLATANESSVGAPSLIEQLADASNDINTIEFYGEDDDETGQSQKSSLFESPFLHRELPDCFNEV